jgi:sulfite oxidase
MPLGLVALNADVLSPADGATVAAGPVELRGYAFAGGERYVARVDVSIDDGATWWQAELLEDLGRWAWRHWHHGRPRPRGARDRRARLGLLGGHPAGG